MNLDDLMKSRFLPDNDGKEVVNLTAYMLRVMVALYDEGKSAGDLKAAYTVIEHILTLIKDNSEDKDIGYLKVKLIINVFSEHTGTSVENICNNLNNVHSAGYMFVASGDTFSGVKDKDGVIVYGATAEPY